MKKLLVTFVCAFLIIGCSKTDVSGIWKGKLTSSTNKSSYAEFNLKQNNKDLTGHMMLPDLFSLNQFKLTGTVSDNKVSFNTEPGHFYMSFIGTIEKNTIKGIGDVALTRSSGDVINDKMTLELSNDPNSDISKRP